jgi:hypothetical protein
VVGRPSPRRSAHARDVGVCRRWRRAVRPRAGATAGSSRRRGGAGEDPRWGRRDDGGWPLPGARCGRPVPGGTGPEAGASSSDRAGRRRRRQARPVAVQRAGGWFRGVVAACCTTLEKRTGRMTARACGGVHPWRVARCGNVSSGGPGRVDGPSTGPPSGRVGSPTARRCAARRRRAGRGGVGPARRPDRRSARVRRGAGRRGVSPRGGCGGWCGGGRRGRSVRERK